MKLLVDSHEVVVWNRTKEKISNIQDQITNTQHYRNLTIAEDIEDLVKKSSGDELGPRIVWTMLPAGEATAQILAEIKKFVKKEDIVVDGGNSKYTDTQKSYDDFTKDGIEFLGIGVSGGLIAAVDGYPLMAGGSRTAYEFITPILDSLAKPKGGHEYFGEGGAGHFVKMVHNGIEYGLMESIGEGFGLLDKSSYNFDLLKIAQLYRKNTLVSGFFMDRVAEVLAKDPKLERIDGVIGSASGEAVWAIEEAKKEDVRFEVIEQSLEIRQKSESDSRIRNSFAAKMVAGQRGAFGGHEVKVKEEV